MKKSYLLLNIFSDFIATEPFLTFLIRYQKLKKTNPENGVAGLNWIYLLCRP
jgi:hypothetical protein